MARSVKFNFSNTILESTIAKVDRSKLYGSSKKIVRDFNGDKCVLSSLYNGDRILPKGSISQILLNNKELRNLLELEIEIGKEKLDQFIENTKFIENDGDTKSFDITLKKGGMIIFDEFGFHRGSCPALTDRVVLRFLYRPKHYFYQL